jgi:hypothetical protein
VQPFEPHSLPLNELDWRQLLPLVGQANAALARYDYPGFAAAQLDERR